MDAQKEAAALKAVEAVLAAINLAENKCKEADFSGDEVRHSLHEIRRWSDYLIRVLK